MADFNQRLRDACESGHVTTVSSCLSAGANVNTRDYIDWTPLHLAMWHNHPQVVTILLSRQDIDITAVDNTGQTALHMACERGSSACIPLLGSIMTVSMINTKCVYGVTALMVAVKDGHLSCVEEMGKLEGVDWETRESEGKTLEDVARYVKGSRLLNLVVIYLSNKCIYHI